jgi:hypothetical protein
MSLRLGVARSGLVLVLAGAVARLAAVPGAPMAELEWQRRAEEAQAQVVAVAVAVLEAVAERPRSQT